MSDIQKQHILDLQKHFVETEDYTKQLIDSPENESKVNLQLLE